MLQKFSVHGNMYGLCDFDKYTEEMWDNDEVYPEYTKLVQDYLNENIIQIEYNNRKAKILPFKEHYLGNPIEEEDIWQLEIPCQIKLKDNEKFDSSKVCVVNHGQFSPYGISYC